MMALPRAERATELLDQPRHDPHELAQSLAQIAAVNRWLGGERALLRHVTPCVRPDRPTTVLDVGTGSADLPRALVRWSRRHGRALRVIATDIHPQTRAFAEARCRAFPEIGIQAADALALPYADRSFDVATISLTLHHFERADQVRVLRELARVARERVIVNELRRSRLNYAGARLLAATLWRGNRLTRHDGPLSVLRAFTGAELTRVAAAADLRCELHRHFFQRLVLVVHV